MTDYTEEQVQIVTEGIENEMKDDDILMKLFQTGVAFSALRTMFNGILSDKGLRMSTKDRKNKTAELLADTEITDETDSSDVLSLVSQVQDALKCTSVQASNAIKAWAKEKGYDLPKMPKKTPARKVGFSGIIQTLLDQVLANKEITKEELTKFADENGIKHTYVTNVMNIVNFAKQYNSESEVEEVQEAA